MKEDLSEPRHNSLKLSKPNTSFVPEWNVIYKLKGSTNMFASPKTQVWKIIGVSQAT